MIVLVASMLVLTACTSNSVPNTPSTDTGSNAQGTVSNNAGSPAASSGTADAPGTSNPDATPPATSNPSPSNEKVLNVEGYSFGWKVTGPQINVGDKVKLIITDTSGVHGFALPDFGVDSGAMSPGDTKTMEFTADKAGSFQYFCNIPCGEGHRSMRGTLTVN